MRPETFERVAARFESLSGSRPRLYRAFVASLGLAGFAFLAVWLVALAAVFAGLVAVGIAHVNRLALKLALGLGLVTALLIRSTWARVERPTGVVVWPLEAPALFREIERLRGLESIPPIHRVLIDGRLNAALMQTPRLGIPGWDFNDLVLGYPLLACLSPDEFRAVLAHEVGHLSGRHGRVAAWSYRVRLTWSQLLEALERRRSPLTGAFRWFLSVYGPWFSAASLALVRVQERDADLFSARATSPRIAADALVAVRVAEFALERHLLAPLRKSSATHFEPPRNHLIPVEDSARKGMAELGAEVELARALSERSRGLDTHPSLAERLASLGEAPRLPPRPAQSAASAFLGPAAGRIREEIEEAWRAEVSANWADAHLQGTRAVALLTTLDGLANRAHLPLEASLDRALLIEQFRSSAEALPLMREIATKAPDLALARFHAGRLLLEAGESDGLLHVERAIALDPTVELEGLELIVRHLIGRGERKAAEPWLERLDQVSERERAGALERSGVHSGDEVEPHGLAPDVVSALLSTLRGDRRIRHVYLAKKRLSSSPGRAPIYLLGVVPDRPFWRPLGSESRSALEKSIAKRTAGPFKVFVLVDSASTHAILRRTAKLQGSRVW